MTRAELLYHQLLGSDAGELLIEELEDAFLHSSEDPGARVSILVYVQGRKVDAIEGPPRRRKVGRRRPKEPAA